jgi:hypothetical protein
MMGMATFTVFYQVHQIIKFANFHILSEFLFNIFTQIIIFPGANNELV